MLSVNQLRKRIKPVTGLRGKKRFETIINNNYYRNKINKLQTHNNNMITKKAKLNIVISNLKRIEKVLDVGNSDDALNIAEHQSKIIDSQDEYINDMKSESDRSSQTISKLKKENDSLLDRLSKAQVKLEEYNKQPSSNVSDTSTSNSSTNSRDDNKIGGFARNNDDNDFDGN